jgi:hypothetical protein
MTRLGGVPMAMQGPPDCDIREVARHRTLNGCMLIEYQGSDGNTYHEFIGLFGTVWFVTYPLTL